VPVALRGVWSVCGCFFRLEVNVFVVSLSLCEAKSSGGVCFRGVLANKSLVQTAKAAHFCVECRVGAGLVGEIGVKSGCVRW
jgi:hypothetical protein